MALKFILSSLIVINDKFKFLQFMNINIYTTRIFNKFLNIYCLFKYVIFKVNLIMFLFLFNEILRFTAIYTLCIVNM